MTAVCVCYLGLVLGVARAVLVTREDRCATCSARDMAGRSPRELHPGIGLLALLLPKVPRGGYAACGLFAPKPDGRQVQSWADRAVLACLCVSGMATMMHAFCFWAIVHVNVAVIGSRKPCISLRCIALKPAQSQSGACCLQQRNMWSGNVQGICLRKRMRLRCVLQANMWCWYSTSWQIQGVCRDVRHTCTCNLHDSGPSRHGGALCVHGPTLAMWCKFNYHLPDHVTNPSQCAVRIAGGLKKHIGQTDRRANCAASLHLYCPV